MTRKTIIAGILCLTWIVAGAQLNSSVNVEGEYEPLVIETERLNAFPLGYRFELPAPSVSYEYEGIVTDFRPDLLTMGATRRQTDWPWTARRGFADFRMGSYLNSKLHAGYYLLTDDRQSLLAQLEFNMSTLSRSRVPVDYTSPSRKRLYDGRFSLGYSRLLGSEGLLDAEVSYRLGFFNYYGTTAEKALSPDGIKAPYQTLNNAAASVAYVSVPSLVRGWHAEARMNYLGYRRLYGPHISLGHGDRETTLEAGAGYAFNFADNSAIGLDAGGTFLFYGSPADGEFSPFNSRKRNYGLIDILPSYRFEKGYLAIKAGADFAVAYDAMGNKPGKKFGALHIAPDVAIDYRSDAGLGIFLEAKGGVTPSTLAMRADFDRYQMPWLLSTQPVYSPLDARVGVNAGPFAGFRAGIDFRYVVAKNVPIGGWYQAFLGSWPQFPAALDPSLIDPYMQGMNLNGISIGLKTSYAFGTMIEVSLDGHYIAQNGKKGIFNGFDRPRWILEAEAVARPMAKLKIEMGYGYRGVRNCYAWTDSGELEAWRLPDITDLNAKVTYSILDNFDIYCQGDNLINRRVDILPGLQSEGIVISGGIYVEF